MIFRGSFALAFLAVVFTVTACSDDRQSRILTKLVSIEPETAAVGEPVTIRGKVLGKKAAKVFIADTEATVEYWSPTVITAVVPKVGPSAYPVFIRIQKWKSNELQLTVTEAESSDSDAPDTTEPDTSLTDMPPLLTNGTQATFTFTGTDDRGVDGFECRLDGSKWLACTTPHTVSSLANGEHRFEVRAVDAAGNVDSAPAVHDWTVDLVAPAATIVAGPDSLTNATEAMVTFTASDNIGPVTTECRLDGAAWSACLSPMALTGLAEGAHDFEVRAVDGAGNVQALATAINWAIDLTAPDTSITSAPDSMTNATSASFSFTGSDNQAVVDYECRLDSGSWEACSSPQSYTGLTEGAHDFDVRAVDFVGNVDASPAPYGWTIDRTEPESTISARPSAVTKVTSADFNFSGTDNVAIERYECRLDAGTWETCASPKSYTGLAEGAHQLEVRAADTAGNVQATPDAWSWSVDLTAPNTSITDSPASIINSTSAAFTFDGSDNVAVAGYECRLDSESWESCASPKTYAALTEGMHIFDVRAVDTSANVDATPVSYSWRIDLTPPDTSFTVGRDAVTNSTSAVLSFTGSDDISLSSYECRLDAGAWEACTSPHAYASLGEGAHEAEVRAVDEAGNLDATPDAWSWVVDLTEPTSTISAGPDAVTNATSANFTFAGSDNVAVARYECRLDGGTWETCTSPKSYAGLAEGTHDLEVRAIDTAGNAQSTPDTGSWTVDQTPPDTSITSTPDSITNATAASFSFAGTDTGGIAGYECRLDSGTWASCTSPKSYAGLSEGLHVFDVRAVDTADNRDATPASASWRIDLTSPDTSITAGPDAVTNSTSAVLSFTGSDDISLSSYECRLDAGAWEACTSPHAYASLGGVAHDVEVRAVDEAGNLDATPDAWSWVVDLIEPTSKFSAGPDAVTSSTSASFTFSGSDNIAVDLYECRLDGGSWETCTSPKSYSGLAEGTHELEVRAVDTAGNVQSTPDTWSWAVDQTPPDTSITSAPASITNVTAASFSFTGTDTGGIAGYECRLDSGSWASCMSPKSYSGLSEGLHVFDVRAVDTAGNRDATPASVSWRIDLTPPDTAITAGPAAVTNSTSAVLSFTGSDDTSLGSYECRLDAGVWEACTSPHAYASLSGGAHDVEVRAVDEAGNRDATPDAWSWTIDLTEPTCSISGGPNVVTNSTSASFTLSGSDNVAIARYECRLNGGSWETCTSPKAYSGLAEGTHDLEVRAVDTAGNVQTTPYTWLWTVDQTAPDTLITDAPVSITNTTTASFSFTGTDNVSVAGFECRLNEGTWVACTSPHNLAGLAEGPHIFEIHAIDNAGNMDETPASGSWTVVLPPPETIFIDGPVTRTTNVPLVISGWGLGVTRGTVSIGEKPADIFSWKDYAVRVTIPTDLEPGEQTVHIYDYSGSLISTKFVFLVPHISARTPGDLYSLESITLNGDSFGTLEGTVEVNGVGAAISTWSNTQIVVEVPSNTAKRERRLIVYPRDAEPVSVSFVLRGSDVWIRPGYGVAGPTTRVGHTAVWTGSEMIVWGGEGIGGSWCGEYKNDGAKYNPGTDTWVPMSKYSSPLPRVRHSSVWTGNELIVWGGYRTYWDSGSGNCRTTYMAHGARYNPRTDTWAPLSTVNQPTAGVDRATVWTGKEMIIWSGGRYNPETDTWRAISTINAPQASSGYKAVWSGKEMIVWGSVSPGGRYNPETDTWLPISTINAPNNRSGHSMVWTEEEMLVWGGSSGDQSGGAYDPDSDTWRTLPVTDSTPSARINHSAVWSGDEMIIWGGGSNTGARYDPKLDTWSPISLVNAPLSREKQTMVWTGIEAIIWGGTRGDGGGRYIPNDDVWLPSKLSNPTGYGNVVAWDANMGSVVTWDVPNGVYDASSDTWIGKQTVDPSSTRRDGSVVWTGTELIVWGGTAGCCSYLSTGVKYNPVTDTWVAISGSARTKHSAVWTGNYMIIWGGSYGGELSSGRKYDPATNAWSWISSSGAPAARTHHTAIWSGSQMIVWGGISSGQRLNTGGRYNQSTDTWSSMSTSGGPSARNFHSALWTGAEMIVWGGLDSNGYSLNTGAIYNPSANTWTPMAVAPSGMDYFAGVWNGSKAFYIRGGSSQLVYTPATNSWSLFYLGLPFSTPSAVWTGTEIFIVQRNSLEARRYIP